MLALDQATLRRMIFLDARRINSDLNARWASHANVAAQSGSNRDYENAPRRAVESLSLMGSAGCAALIELRNKGLLRDAQARSFAIWFLARR